MNFKNILTEWNDGIFRGAQAKFAREMGVSKVTVMRWLSGALRPSEKQIKNMAKLFKKSEEEIKSMFVVDNSVNQQANGNSGNVISGNSFSNVGNVAASHGGAEAEIKELAAKVEQMGKDIQILNLKMDLILEKMKGK